MTDIATLTMNPALDLSTSVDKLVPAHKLRCAPPRTEAGGGGINVARAVVQLGGSAVALFPSGGPAGKQIEALLEKAKVPFRTAPIAGMTRESFSVEDDSDGCQYRFVLPGPELGEAEQDGVIELIRSLDPRPRYLIASGSLPPGVEPRFYHQVGTLCRALGIGFMLDTSGPALAACGDLGALLLKPSIHELEAAAGRTLPTDADRTEAARALIGCGCTTAVLVSLGGEGALLVTGEDSVRYPAIKVEVQSTVGAGDSMLAAVALGLVNGKVLPEAVRYGIAAGAAALLAPGTGLAHREDVERLMNEAG